MEASSQKNIRTIAVGGAAGDGIREAGIHFAQFLHKLGFGTYLGLMYPSLIRGGHNFARVSYAGEPVASDYAALDVLVAVNEESVKLHLANLKEDAIVFVDSVYEKNVRALWSNTVALPMYAFAKELNAPHTAATSVALGAFAYHAGMSLDALRPIAEFAFADYAGTINLQLAEKGYAHAASLGIAQRSTLVEGGKEMRGMVLEGNKAVGKGLVTAGLDFYVAYPMTPATSLLHYLARTAHEQHLTVIQPEDEIAVINMALGISYAGKRVAIGSATGGFALMQESFALAGITELPLVVVVSQRQGPATGVATHTSQGDLQFVLHSGHGEFPRIVLAPGDPEEAFLAGAHALNLTWKFQVPVIVLLDKRLSENMCSSVLATDRVGHERIAPAQDVGESYLRYRITEDGVSPMAFPGTPDTAVKASSYEHNEEGVAIDAPEEVKAMQDKRFRKVAKMTEILAALDTVKTYGDRASDIVIVCWGSTKGPVLEATKYLTRPVKILQVICMEPFDAGRIAGELRDARVIIDVEANHNAQFAALLREKTGIAVTHKVLRYDAHPFEPLALAAELNTIIA